MFIPQKYTDIALKKADATRKATSLPVAFSLGVYGDIGKLYPNSVGLTLRFSYDGFHRF